MNIDTIDKHSVNCYFCSALVDERECLPGDNYNINDGGHICPDCQQHYKFRILHETVIDGWINFGDDLYSYFEEAEAEVQEVIDEMDGYNWSQFRIVTERCDEKGQTKPAN